MNRLFIALFFLGLSSMANAQQPGCDGIRYLEHVFTDVDIITEVTFGQNTTQGGILNSLEMDIYQPMGDVLNERPVVVLAHGGSFIAGMRQDMSSICIDLALRGYVTVTIDYRLYDVFAIPSKDVVNEIVVQAVGDMKAAIRFLREDADNGNTYGIDPDYIFAGGVSAGAITAVHVGFVDAGDDLGETMSEALANNGGLDGDSSDNTSYSSAVQGILNYSGAVKNVDWIGLNNPPIFSAHDEFDTTVPYGSETTTALITPVFLEGSGSIHEKTEEIGLWNNLITLEGSSGHVSYFSNPGAAIYSEVLDASAFMLEYVYCNQITSVAEVQLPHYGVYPNPVNDQLNVVSIRGRSMDKIKMFDLQGRVVLELASVGGSRVELSTSFLAPGSYILKVLSGSKWESQPVIVGR